MDQARLRGFPLTTLALLVTTGAGLLVRTHLQQGTPSMLLVVTVVLGASSGRLSVAAYAVVGSYLANAYFFHPPYGSFRVQNGIAGDVVVSLLVSVLVVRLVRRLRETEQVAARAGVAEEADRLHTALLRAVAHDVKSPLAAVTAAVSDLADPDLDLAPAPRRELAGVALAGSRQLDRIVTDLLDLSRVEAGALPLHLGAVDVTDLATAVARAHPAGDVTVDLPTDLPLVRADEALLERVTANLVLNGLRHGGGAVEIGGRVRADRVELVVVDHGPGLPAHPGGRGSGLSIVEAFATAQAAQVRSEQQPDGRHAMVVSLPVQDVPT